MDILRNIFGSGNTAVATPPDTKTVVQQQVAPTVDLTTSTTTSPKTPLTTVITGQDLAAPVVPNNLGGRVIRFLTPAAELALQEANIDQDFSKASSIADFIDAKLLSKLKGEGKSWEGSIEQAYTRALVDKLAAVAKEVENDLPTALDAVKSIAYVAGSLQNPQAVKIAFQSLVEIAEPSSYQLANNDKALARQAELKIAVEPLVAQLIQEKPIEAIGSVLKGATSFHRQLTGTRLENTVALAIHSPNNKSGAVETEILGTLVSISTNDRGINNLGDLQHYLQNVEAIGRGVNQARSNDQRLVDQITKVKAQLAERIAERRAG